MSPQEEAGSVKPGGPESGRMNEQGAILGLSPTLERERTQHFTGRAWVFDKLDVFLAGSKRWFLLTGGAGTGKSAIATRLVQISRAQAASDGRAHLGPGFLYHAHFCRAEDDRTIRPLRFVEALSSRLVASFGPCRAAVQAALERRGIHIDVTQTVETATGPVTGIGQLHLPEELSPRDAFDDFIRAPLEALYGSNSDYSHPLVILVDALDEALAYRGGETLVALLGGATDDPEELPAEVRLILTARDIPEVEHVLGPSDLDLIKDAPADVDDVRRYATGLFERSEVRSKAEALATTVAEASKGNFLYARYVVKDLLAHPDHAGDPKSLDLPTDLPDVYRRFLKRDLAKDLDAWGQNAPFLGMLAVAQGSGLTPDQLTGAAGLERTEAERMLRAVSPFLSQADAKGRLQIFHQSFREFLLTDHDLGVDAQRANQQLGEYFFQEYQGEWLAAEDDYALAYTVIHLIQALQHARQRRERQRSSDLLGSILTDLGYMEARARRGWIYELMTDLVGALDQLPEDHPGWEVLDRLQELLSNEAAFIAAHPQAFFQALWNRGWWYDAPQSADFFEPPPGGWAAGQAPWDRPGEKLYKLLERWREQRKESRKTGSASPWLRALRPPPDPLGSAQIGVFLGRGDESFKLALSPDERMLIYGGGEDSGIVKVLDLTNGGEELASRSFAEGEYMGDLSLSPRGDIIVVALGDNSLRLLDPQDLHEIGRLLEPANSEDVGILAFSPDGSRLVSGDNDGGLIVWDMDNRGKLASVKAHTGQVTALAFAPDGREFASGEQSFDGGNAVRRWRLDGDVRQVEELLFDDWITGLAYAPSGQLLACSLYSERIKTYDLDGGAVGEFQVSGGEHAACLAFTPDGGALVAGAGDVFSAAYTYCWDLESGKLKWKLPGHNFVVDDLIIFQNGRRLLTAGDNTIRLWNLELVARGLILNSAEPDIDHVLFSRDGKVVFTASKKSETVRARQVDTGQLLHRWEAHTGGVTSLAATTDGARLATGCGDGAVRVWEVSSGQEWMTDRDQNTSVGAIAFSPDGHLLAIGYEGSARLVDIEQRREIGVLIEDVESVKELSFSLDGRLVLTGSYRSIIIWETATQRNLSEFGEQGGLFTYYSTCFTDDSRYVVVEGVGESLTAWEALTGQRVSVEEVHRQAFRRLKMRKPSPWTWEDGEDAPRPRSTPSQRPELALRHSDTGVAIAWLSIPYGEILYHPDVDIWGIRRGGHLHIYKLEDV
jgi:WD40 repeat protein